MVDVAYGINSDVYAAVIDVRDNLDTGDIRFRHRFQPHRLPYSSNRRVPDTARFLHLLTAGLVAGICRVPYRQNNLLRPRFFQRIGDIESESVVSALMLADLFAVDPHRCVPVHRAKVQQNPLALSPPAGAGYLKCSPIPQPVIFTHRLHHTRQSRLNRKRYENLAIEFFGLLCILGYNGIFPQPVEILPVLADHLRPGILTVGLAR